MSELENSVSLLGPEVGYTDLLDHVIHEKIQKEQDGEREGTFLYNPLRPSAAGYCAKRLAFATNEFRGHKYYEKTPKIPETYRLLELGHAVEFSALKNFQLLKVMSVRFKQQSLLFFPVERADNSVREFLHGSCDFVLWSDKYKAIGDVKSRKDGFSAAYKTRWDEELATFAGMGSLVQLSETAFYADDLDALLEELGDDFLTDNLQQLNLYANSDFMQKLGVDHGFIYRYNKNDSRHIEIRFRPSVKAAQYVQDKFNQVSVAVDKQDFSAVPKEFMLGSMRCAFCPYSKECWGDDDSLRAWFNTFPKKGWPTDLEREDLVEKFLAYEKGLTAIENTQRIETQILKELSDLELKKVRLPNGNVYETKYLKSPQPHLELRRSKI